MPLSLRYILKLHRADQCKEIRLQRTCQATKCADGQQADQGGNHGIFNRRSAAPIVVQVLDDLPAMVKSTTSYHAFQSALEKLIIYLFSLALLRGFAP